MMRRHLFRLLRLRNLLMLMIMVVLLYLVRMLSNVKVSIDESNVPQEALRALAGHMGDIPYFVPKSLKKKDWHNYTQIAYERKRVGIGEQGLPAYLSEQEAELKEKLYTVNGFNGALSDKIPLNRSLPDIRHPGCKETLYLESLPSVSVVVPFHNEHWSTLLRTVYSVLHRSPEHLIKEIFLVDDASTKEFLGAKLDAYLAAHMPKVSVVRLGKRSGLITARLAGARRSTADVLLFLDSHTEANVNWLPPLLEPIAQAARTAACPYIDVVAHDTLQYRAQDAGARGAFDWELYYKRLPLLPQDAAGLPRPFPSPVMAGGLFAISRAFFWELGGYDPGLDIWGGEQYELSFKIWQCGGRVVDVPCARVGHVYRKFAPFPDPGRGDFVGRNYRRVAEVWMDEYAQYVYSRRPHYRDLDPGDLAAQRALRRRLRCRPFRWFMTQIAFDLTAKYPPVEPEPFAQGRIRPAEDKSLCVDAGLGAPLAALQLVPCHRAKEADFLFTWHKDIRSASRNMCWDLPESAPREPVRLYACHLGGGNQAWRYLPDTKQIKHDQNDNCLEYTRAPPAVHINRCAPGAGQRWEPERVHAGRLDGWDSQLDRLTGPVEPWDGD